MQKLVCATVIVALLCGLLGCGASADKAPPTTQPAAVTSQVFLAGFGKADFTPTDPVPMGGYGNSLERMSTGILSYLEARAVAVTDENGQSLIFIVGDLS